MAFELLILLALVFLVFSFVRQRRTAQRQAAQQRDSLQVGARVMTTSGLYGTVLGVEGDSVELEVAPGVRTTWLVRAVARRVDEPAVAGEPGAPTTATGATSASAAAGTGAADEGTTLAPGASTDPAAAADPTTPPPERPAPGAGAPGDDAGGAQRPGAA